MWRNESMSSSSLHANRIQNEEKQQQQRKVPIANFYDMKWFDFVSVCPSSSFNKFRENVRMAAIESETICQNKFRRQIWMRFGENIELELDHDDVLKVL